MVNQSDPKMLSAKVTLLSVFASANKPIEIEEIRSRTGLLSPLDISNYINYIMNRKYIEKNGHTRKITVKGRQFLANNKHHIVDYSELEKIVYERHKRLAKDNQSLAASLKRYEKVRQPIHGHYEEKIPPENTPPLELNLLPEEKKYAKTPAILDPAEFAAEGIAALIDENRRLKHALKQIYNITRGSVKNIDEIGE